MENKKYIIGGGISGLTYAFLNPEYQLIAPPYSDKDQYSRSYLIWLHDCASMRIFLNLLGFQDLDMRIKKSHIGYFHEGRIYDAMTEEMKENFLLNKMNEWDSAVASAIRDSGDGSKFSLTETKNENNFMNTIDLDTGTLLFALRRAIGTRHIPASVLEINDKYIRISNTNEYDESVCVEYDRLVSTIPAPVFYNLYSPDLKKPELKSLPTTNIVVRREPENYDRRYELIYYGKEFEYSRISHLHNKFCYEYTGIYPVEEFKKKNPMAALGLFDYWVQPKARVFTEAVVPPNSKIDFVGRFAQWDHSITTEHVVKKALEEKYAT